jgi:hypothetical protein
MEATMRNLNNTLNDKNSSAGCDGWTVRPQCRRLARFLRFALAGLLLTAVPPLHSQSSRLPAGDKGDGSLTLSPSVIMLQGKAGQSTRQTLRMTNSSAVDLGFEMMAQDIVTRDGQRVYIPAGQLPGSIAATAVFSQPLVEVPAKQTAAVEVTLTVPEGSAVRAVAVIFRTRQLTDRRQQVGIATSLGALITFNLSNDISLEASGFDIVPQSANQNLTVSQWLTNTGKEPVIPSGVVAWLDANGKLIGKSTVEPHRLLPGERLAFRTEFPMELRPGKYRTLVAMQYGEKSLTTSREIIVP